MILCDTPQNTNKNVAFQTIHMVALYNSHKNAVYYVLWNSQIIHIARLIIH